MGFVAAVKTAKIAAGALCFVASNCVAMARDAAPSPVTRMFAWWNEAVRQPGAFTPQQFSRFFTRDAELVIDGVVVAHGLPALSDHFARIQASGAQVQIVLPFETEFRSGNWIYTYHVIRSTRKGVEGCMLAAGHARIDHDRIDALSLVRSKLDPSGSVFAAKCRRN